VFASDVSRVAKRVALEAPLADMRVLVFDGRDVLDAYTRTWATQRSLSVSRSRRLGTGRGPSMIIAAIVAAFYTLLVAVHPETASRWPRI
jgi:hypothetical protein